jgi:ABC-type glycerol-3-phosphate transport system substrate-binding protein
MKTRILIIITVIFLMGISACSAKSAANPADATLAYLQALADKNKETVVSLSCKSWEEQANLEVDALMSVEAQLNNVGCQQKSSAGDNALVDCSGSLDLTYNDEIRSIELDKRTYTMALEDGQWRVCSYQ